MLKNFKVWLFPAMVCLVLISCGKDEQAPDIPDAYVSFSINPNSTQYEQLNVVNGWETVVGGYNGILIFRPGINEFVAFERACAYDPTKEGAQVRVEEGGTICYCPVCKSRYIMTDGTPIEGPSHFPLKQYSTVYDGTMLYISN
jgi:nitrite reductase/ring-hydroxylating ferredoxin subunit